MAIKITQKQNDCIGCGACAAIAPNDKAKWDTVMRFFEDVWKVQRKFLREIVRFNVSFYARLL